MIALALVAAANFGTLDVALELSGGGVVVIQSGGLSEGASGAGPTARAALSVGVDFNPSVSAAFRFGLGYRTGQFREGWTDYRFGELALRFTYLRRGDLSFGIEGAFGLGQQRSRLPDSLESSSLGYDMFIVPTGIGPTVTWRPGGLLVALSFMVESYLSTIFYPPTPPVLPGHSLPERSGGVGNDLGARGTLTIGWGFR